MGGWVNSEKGGRVENIKMRGCGGHSQAKVHDWLAVIVSFGEKLDVALEGGQGRDPALGDAVHLRDVLRVELVLALPVLELDEGLSHSVPVFGELN
jgi:hypothetical protein